MSSIIRRIRWWFLASGLLLATVATAQDATTPVGIEPAGDPNDVIEFSLRDETLAQVLYLLEQLTGRSVIRPQALPSPTFTFNSLQPLTREEAILAIESLLSINGIGVAPLGDKFIKVVPISTIRTEAPELVVRSLIGDPPSGKVVSKLFRLTYLDSATFQTQIQPFLSPGFGTIIPFQNSNAVIVTDTISNLQRLEYVVSEVDRPSRLNIETKFYTLQYATASEVGGQINSLIESARSGFGTQKTTPNRGQDPQAAVQPVGPPVPAPTGEGSVPIEVVLGGNTSINWDDRTNQLIVITDPSNLPFFDNIIEKLDIAADPPTRIEVIPLQHADATEVGSLLSQLVSGETKQQGLDVSTNTGQERATPSRPTFGSGDSTAGGRQPGTQNASARAAVLDAVATTLEGRESQFSEFMTIVADERSNALIVSGTNNDLDLIVAIIKQIDIVLAQVRIEVIIAQVRLEENNDRGIDQFNLTYDTALGRVTSFGVDVPTIKIAGDLITGEGATGDDYILDTVFKAAKQNNNIKLLSAPTIVTTHNKEATIIVAESRPIITSSQTSLNIGDSTRSTFQFQDIGITLKVKPLIGPNDVIQMEIDQTVDDIIGNVTIDSNEQPVIGRRQATSFVSVRSSEMIVLGGLRGQTIERNKSRMFPFGYVPGIAPLFTRYTDKDIDQELVVFIRPVVIRNTDDAFVDATKRLNQTKDAESVRAFMENEPEESNEENESSKDSTKPTSHFHKK
ncbi:MAG: secretin N-terminal domain-containing protein [Opitutaceae bacterium]